MAGHNITLVKIDQSKQARVIGRLLLLFSEKCPENSTLLELLAMSVSESQWSGGHALFQVIRQKTLHVDRELNKRIQLRRDHFEKLECQYSFEEICAKSLYNLSGRPAPFDSDSPDWIVTIAVSLAQKLSIERKLISEIVDSAQ